MIELPIFLSTTLQRLQDDRFYSIDAIERLIEDPAQRAQARTTLPAYCSDHDFPPRGDRPQAGPADQPAWTGQRWKLKIFAADEMKLVALQKSWRAEEVLAMDGVFFLKDLARLLRFNTHDVKRHAERYPDEQACWERLGIRKLWSHWIVRMAVFAPYYREHFHSDVARIPEHWDGNTLLRQDGVFYLTDVCEHLPVSAHQLRYQAKRWADSRTRIGVWKDAKENCYLVEMAVFAPWFRALWSRR